MGGFASKKADSGRVAELHGALSEAGAYVSGLQRGLELGHRKVGGHVSRETVDRGLVKQGSPPQRTSLGFRRLRPSADCSGLDPGGPLFIVTDKAKPRPASVCSFRIAAALDLVGLLTRMSE